MTQFTLRSLDIPALHRHAIGFDQLFEQMERTFANSRGNDNYPPHNVVKLDDTHFVVEVAVAGFKQDEIDVELKDGVLVVKGEKAKVEAFLKTRSVSKVTVKYFRNNPAKFS